MNSTSFNQIGFIESLSELTVGSPKTVGSFLRPQNNSSKTYLDANLKDSAVNNGFSNHKKLAKASRSLIKSCYDFAVALLSVITKLFLRFAFKSALLKLF